jgi:hypothetical protein
MNIDNKEQKLLTGNNNIYWKGVIEDNKDPLEAGRCRVRIYGIHSHDISLAPTDSLPWAITKLGFAFGGLIGGVGISCIPKQGSWVSGYFDNEDENTPIIDGILLGINTSKYSGAFADPDGVHPMKTGSDINTKARGNKYRHNIVIETEYGHLIEIDDTKGDERIHIKHKKGTYFLIDKDGNVDIKCVKDHKEVIKGKVDITVDGDVNFISQGAVYLEGSSVTIKGGSTMVI